MKRLARNWRARSVASKVNSGLRRREGEDLEDLTSRCRAARMVLLVSYEMSVGWCPTECEVVSKYYFESATAALTT